MHEDKIILKKINQKQLGKYIDQLLKYCQVGKHEMENGFYTIFHHGNKSWGVKDEGRKYLKIITGMLAAEIPFANWDEYEKVIFDVIQEKIFNKKTDILTFAKQRIVELKTSIQVYEICFIIYNIELEEDFDLGVVKFKPRTLEQKYRLKLRDELVKTSQKFCWACAQSKGTKLYAELEVEPIIQRHIDVLTFLFHAIAVEHTHVIEHHIAQTGTLSPQRIETKLIREKGSNRFIYEDTLYGGIDPIILSGRTLRKIKSNFLFLELDSVLKKGFDTKYTSKLLSGISFFIDAMQEKFQGVKILKYAICIEALLGSKNDQVDAKIQSNLAEKAAFILNKDFEKRKEIINDIKEIYDFGSKVRHGTSENINFNILNKAYLYSRAILTHYVKKRAELQDIDEWFIKQKLT